MGLAILIVWVIILGIAILLIVSNIKIVPQAHAYVVERLGGYKETWGVGLHFKMPILDRVARRVSLKEQVVDFEPQAVITKDNVTMQIDTVVFYQITDPKKYAYAQKTKSITLQTMLPLCRLVIIMTWKKVPTSLMMPTGSGNHHIRNKNRPSILSKQTTYSQ